MIKLGFDFARIPQYYLGLPHQTKALNFLTDKSILNGMLSNADLEEFVSLWRSPEAENPTKLNATNQLNAFLKMLRVGEGTSGEDGYYTMFTGVPFSSFNDHPRQLQRANGLVSDAAGAYQFLSTTWDQVATALGLTDFSPQSQDLAAIELIRRRCAYDDVIAGRITEAVEKCSYEWASLPPGQYDQPIKTFDEVIELFKGYGGYFLS